MNDNFNRPPDIKRRMGNLSIAGWFMDDNFKHTRFELTKSFRLKNNEFNTYRIRLTEEQMLDVFNLIRYCLDENHNILEIKKIESYDEETNCNQYH